MSEVHNILTKSAHGGHAKTYNCITSLTTGLKSPEILRDMSPPATFVKRLDLEDTLQSDYFNLFPYHLSPLK